MTHTHPEAIEYAAAAPELERAANPTRTVTIPACVDHHGFHAITLTLPWICLECGGPRGEPFCTVSYDGSRRLSVHGWSNPCGHVESYSVARAAFLDQLKPS